MVHTSTQTAPVAMKFWKVYYEVNGTVTHGFAQVPDTWGKDRVRRYVKHHYNIDGPVLVEPGAVVEKPDFVFN